MANHIAWTYNLHNPLEIYLWNFVLLNLVFRHNSWKADKAHMSPALLQLGKRRQHFVKEVLSLLQLLACIFVPEIMLPEECSARIKFWNNTLYLHCLLFQHPLLRDAGKLCYSKELKLSDISLYTFYITLRITKTSNSELESSMSGLRHLTMSTKHCSL